MKGSSKSFCIAIFETIDLARDKIGDTDHTDTEG